MKIDVKYFYLTRKSNEKKLNSTILFKNNPKSLKENEKILLEGKMLYIIKIPLNH
jgi:hypothetical protein